MNDSIRMVVLDLDGTLLKSDQTVDSDTVTYLHKLHDRDVKIVIATGRSRSLVDDILNECHLSCDLILNNGHELMYATETYTFPFDNDKLCDVVNILNNHEMYISAVCAKNKKVGFLDVETYYLKHIEMSRAVRGEDCVLNMDSPLFNKNAYTENYTCLQASEDLRDYEVLKIDAKNLDQKKTEDCYRELKELGGLQLSSSFESYIEVTPDNSDKARGVEWMAEQYGIRPDEIAVFGDSGNDLSMLKQYRNSFAMGNSSETVKKAARYVTDTNDCQGVLKALHKLFD